MRRLATVVAALAVTVAAACGSDSPTQPTQASFAGSWSLQTVNGSALPFTAAQNGADKLDILTDVFTASSAGTFDEMATTRTTINGLASIDTLADSGTYVISGGTVTFRFASDSSSLPGTVSGKTMTITQSGYSFVYRQQ